MQHKFKLNNPAPHQTRTLHYGTTDSKLNNRKFRPGFLGSNPALTPWELCKLGMVI